MEKNKDFINELLKGMELFETKSGLALYLLELSFIYKKDPKKVTKDFMGVYNTLYKDKVISKGFTNV